MHENFNTLCPLLKPQECTVYMCCVIEHAGLVKTTLQILASLESLAVPFGESYVGLGDKSKQ